MEEGWYFQQGTWNGVSTTCNGVDRDETLFGVVQLTHDYPEHQFDREFQGNLGMGNLGMGQGLCMLHRDSNKSITANTWTSIDFDAEIVDTMDWHDNVTNNTRITIESDGVYLIGWASYGSTGASGMYLQNRIYLNGTTSLSRTIEYGNTSSSIGTNGVTVAELSADDYLEFQVYMNTSNGTIYGSANGWYTNFWCLRIQ
jgi:hypothetical protein